MSIAVLILACLPLTAFAASWPDVSTSFPGAPGGGEKDAAVIVGAEGYAFVAPVPGAVRNADEWYSYLTRVRKVPVERTTLLRDNEATVEKMRRFARGAADEVEPGGTLWFVFIGHGAPDKEGKDGVLVGADAQQDADSLFARSLPQKELLAALGKGRQDRTVVVLDACFSGRTPEGKALIPGLQPLVVARAAPASDPRVVIMTAGAADQFAGPLPGASRPAFSYLALGGLRGWADANGDGRVSARELVDYSAKALRALVRGRTQTPALVSGDAAAVLGAGSEKGPDLSAMVLEFRPQKSELSFGQSGVKISVPKVNIVSSDGAFGPGMNIEAEKLLEAALDAEEGKDVLPKDKAAAWCRLGELKGTNPYAVKAAGACGQWRAHASALDKAAEGIGQDLGKLGDYLALKRKTKEQKLAAFDAFLAAYAPWAQAWPSLFGEKVSAVSKARELAETTGEFALKGVSSPAASPAAAPAAAPAQTVPPADAPAAGGKSATALGGWLLRQSSGENSESLPYVSLWRDGGSYAMEIPLDGNGWWRCRYGGTEYVVYPVQGKEKQGFYLQPWTSNPPSVTASAGFIFSKKGQYGNSTIEFDGSTITVTVADGGVIKVPAYGATMSYSSQWGKHSCP